MIKILLIPIGAGLLILVLAILVCLGYWRWERSEARAEAARRDRLQKLASAPEWTPPYGTRRQRAAGLGTDRKKVSR